jgi:hypothetical protein
MTIQQDGERIILDMIRTTPGIRTKQIARNLLEAGHDITYDWVTRELRKIKRAHGLEVQKEANGQLLWFSGEATDPKTWTTQELILSILQRGFKPLTATQIEKILREEYERDISIQKLANVCQMLVRYNRAYKAGVVKSKDTQRPTNLYGYGPKPSGFTPTHADTPISRIVPRLYTPHHTETDSQLNERTMATVPSDHMPMILEAAERMRKFRKGNANYGTSYIPKESACDYPIRQLFIKNRDDALETRYSALALWLSWEMETNEEAA